MGIVEAVRLKIFKNDYYLNAVYFTVKLLIAQVSVTNPILMKKS